MEIMEPMDIARYYEEGTLGSFSMKLMDLFGIADLENRKRLKKSFPNHGKGWMIWFKGEYKIMRGGV